MPPYGSFRGEARPPNPTQAALHASRAAFKLFLGGVGAGKTFWGCRELVLSALENGPDCRYIVGAPSEKILRQATFDTYLRFVNDCARVNGRRIAVRIRTSPAAREIVLSGNIVISFVGLKKPHEFAGPTIAGFHLDEGGLLSDGTAAWDVLLERLRDTNAARLFGLVTTTPRGPVGVVQHFIEQCAWDDRTGSCGADRNPDYDMMVSTTWENRANLAADYIERQIVGKTERQVDQQLRARVLDFKGAVYAGEFTQRSMARGWTAEKGLTDDTEVYLAIDWGPNMPHVLWIAHDPEGDHDVVFDELCDDGMHARDLLDRAIQHGQARYGLSRTDYAGVYCDPNPASATATAQAYFGRPARHSDRRRKDRSGWVPVRAWTVRAGGDLPDGIETVAWRLRDCHGKRRLFFAPQLAKTPSRRRILQCMRLYCWRERQVQSETVMDDLRPVKGVFDHGADALRMYIWPRYRHLRYIDARRVDDGDRANPGR